MKSPKWIKKKKGQCFFFDGDVIAVTLQVKNNKTGHTYWDVYRLRVLADDDRLEFYKDDTDEHWTEWQWEDVEFYMVIDGHGPMTKAEAERMA